MEVSLNQDLYLPKKCDWGIDPEELDFSNSTLVGNSKEVIDSLLNPVSAYCNDRLVIKDFRHEVNLLVKLRHPNIVQFLGAVADKKPLMLVTEYLRGGDLHQHLKGKWALIPSTAISFAMDIARGMAYLHSEPNVIVHRDLKPRLVGGLMYGENRVELLLISIWLAMETVLSVCIDSALSLYDDKSGVSPGTFYLSIAAPTI
ncbi:hypothetical protein AAHA92_12258 [Salvia divinorum]|uniref:Protein kinase domain-containing protein n=1 Tax=Salvia divinorum TaxID=28513 RepID=A0ABD1HJN5_SALDI